MRFLALILLAGCTCMTGPDIIARTMDADNVIHNYEWFHDVNQAILARRADIASYKELQTVSPDSETITMELNALKMSCRGLVADYNANASKVNRNIFRGTSTPAGFDLLPTCE